MAHRIRFIAHQAKQILLVDLSNCSASEVEKIARTLPEVVTTRQLGSVLVLSDFTGASLRGSHSDYEGNSGLRQTLYQEIRMGGSREPP
jgi:hypothetical protein